MCDCLLGSVKYFKERQSLREIVWLGISLISLSRRIIQGSSGAAKIVAPGKLG